MQVEEVIKTINQMQADGVIERYAIGGTVGATFYLEPVATLEVESLLKPASWIPKNSGQFWSGTAWFRRGKNLKSNS